jgi:hypothetical protein
MVNLDFEELGVKSTARIQVTALARAYPMRQIIAISAGIKKGNVMPFNQLPLTKGTINKGINSKPINTSGLI